MSRGSAQLKIVTKLARQQIAIITLKSYRGGCQRCTYEFFSRLAWKITKMRAIVREITQKLGRHVAILGTSRGPKSVYHQSLKEGKVFLNIGEKFLLYANPGKA